MNPTNDKDFVQSLVSNLELSASNLEPEVIEKLNLARTQAVTVAQANEDKALVTQIQTKLGESESLNPAIQRKLNQMRDNAVNQGISDPKPWPHAIQKHFDSLFGNGFGMTAGMVATACLILTVATLFYTDPRAPVTLPVDENLGLIASADELELYENLDFYLWLAENELLN